MQPHGESRVGFCSGCSWGWLAALDTPVSGPALYAHRTHVCPCLVAEMVASPPSQNNGTTSPDPFESQPLTMAASKPGSARKTPESFLGPNAALVNLDSLVTRPAPPAQSLNPFLAPGMLASRGFCWLSTLPENGFAGRPLGPHLWGILSTMSLM